MVMKDSKWQPCIASYFDLPNIKKQAETGQASALMRKMHALALTAIDKGFPSHVYGYIWNDSVLLVSHLTRPAAERRKVLKELSLSNRSSITSFVFART